MKLEEIKNKTSKLLFFDKKSLKLLEKDDNNLNANLKYWLKIGDLVALKKGFYIFKDKYEKETAKDEYLEYLANRLLSPSYLSLEYVLNKYQLLSEPARVLTSISDKTAREFSNSLGTWRYYSLPAKLFIGYKIKYFKNQPIAEASKAKALFDFLYLRFRRGNEPAEKSLADLRLNLENINQKEKTELFSYFKLVPGKRWLELKKIIEKYAA
ncbi:MAG: hypothetical protein WCL13_02030 [bacterium]